MTAYRKAHGGFWIYDCFAARPFAHRALSTANTTILWGFARVSCICGYRPVWRWEAGVRYYIVIV